MVNALIHGMLLQFVNISSGPGPSNGREREDDCWLSMKGAREHSIALDCRNEVIGGCGRLDAAFSRQPTQINRSIHVSQFHTGLSTTALLQ